MFCPNIVAECSMQSSWPINISLFYGCSLLIEDLCTALGLSSSTPIVLELGIVARVCYHSTREARAGWSKLHSNLRLYQGLGQAGLHRNAKTVTNYSCPRIWLPYILWAPSILRKISVSIYDTFIPHTKFTQNNPWHEDMKEQVCKKYRTDILPLFLFCPMRFWRLRELPILKYATIYRGNLEANSRDP